MHTVFIGIGSNLGDRDKNCKMAVELLSARKIAKNIIISKFYETKAMLPNCTSPQKRCPTPFGGTPNKSHKKNDWPDFINGVARVETELSPKELLSVLHNVEAELGRIRTGVKWEPRTIDLDILFYDDLVIDTPELKVPHPELHKRMFVLAPLCDIAEELIHPIFKITVKELKEKL